MAQEMESGQFSWDCSWKKSAGGVVWLLIKFNFRMKKNLFRRIALWGAVAAVALMAALLPAGLGPPQGAQTGGKTNTAVAAGAGMAALNTNALTHTLAAKDADAAWIELQNAMSTRPPVPDAWQLQEPSAEEQIRFFMPYIMAIADKARDFYSRFPKDTNAIEAKLSEFGALSLVVDQTKSTNQQPRLDAALQAILADPKLPDDVRFDLRQHAVEKAVHEKEAEGDAAVLVEFEKGARTLQKEFPKRPEVLDMLMYLAEISEPEKSRGVAKEISASQDAPDEIKDAAAAMLKQLDRVGKPLTLKFAAVDGREVDLDQMRGKVVLVDFWAAASERSVDMAPAVKEAYDKFHPKGFEIAGIDLDEEKESLTDFVAEQKVEWPQYFDGKSLESQFAAQFGLRETDIPAMWLVDKKGVLRYINAGFDFDKKIERLLAE
jgi:peroxiredoxin